MSPPWSETKSSSELKSVPTEPIEVEKIRVGCHTAALENESFGDVSNVGEKGLNFESFWVGQLGMFQRVVLVFQQVERPNVFA